MADETVTDTRPRLARAVVALSAVSFLTDVAADMVVPYLPLFLTVTLGASTQWVGLVEGVAEATAAVVKYISGRVSDRMPRKKPLVLLGYGVANLVRPLLSIAVAPWRVLAVRFVDRIGKGIRTAPRDGAHRPGDAGAAPGVCVRVPSGMDNLGAVFGPIAAMAVLAATHDDLRMVFAATIVPGMLSLAAVVFFVREVPPVETEATKAAAEEEAKAPLPVGLKRFLVLVAVFTLGNASDGFLVLRAHQLGVATRWLPLLWGALSLLRALAVTPGGWVADRIGRERALTLGWWLYALSWMGFGLATRPWMAGFALLGYGAYYGLTEGTERALVATLAEQRSLGRAYGAFNLVAGLVALPASLLFGALWAYGPRVAFGVGAGFAATAALGMTIRRERRA
ncbi:MAG: MFS transporter [Deltaproteobacteria bacterium]|nr:MFS transporter [Deltaproteobacteria bacterium]